MTRHMLLLPCLVLLCWGASASAAKVKLHVPEGSFSARFLYKNTQGLDVISSSEAVEGRTSLEIPADAGADVVLMVTDEQTDNAARIDLGRPPKQDVDVRLTKKDFSWVETLEVRVTGQPDLQPVAGALVLVRRDGVPEFGWVGETTADGVARVGPLPSGNLTVDVWTEGRAPVSQFVTIDRERPVKAPQIAIALPMATAGEGTIPQEQTSETATPTGPLPMKIFVGLLGLVALGFFAKLWAIIQYQERSRAVPLAPTRPDRPFSGALIAPVMVIAFISGLASAISVIAAGDAESATPYLLVMLAQFGFALIALAGIRGRNDALAGFGASAVTAAFLAPLALGRTWTTPDATMLLAVILNVVGALVGLAMLIAAVAGLERTRIGAPEVPAGPKEATPEPAIYPSHGEPVDEIPGTDSYQAVAEASAPLSGQLVLFGVQGGYVGVEFPLKEQGPTTIGRDPANDIVLEDTTVSRRHAQIERQDGDVVLTDLGSSNGTFVNGRRVQQAPLRPGDEVVIGGCTFRLQVIG